MKNLKKVLSVALALAMALSLMTTAFATVTKASDLTGYSNVGTTYTQAVDMMVGLGVIDGVSGDIQAQGNVTREQAAKIVCTMLLGSDASQLSTTNSYFSDVAATRWSAPYIAYCVENGIVSGVGGGKFNPTGNVTGNQFAKMLLVALGYSASTEGYTGTNWAVNVSGDATEAGIYKNATAINKNSAATREQACLYAWNTVKATLVEYNTTGTSITIGDTSINVGGSKASKVTTTDATAGTRLDSTVASTGNYYYQFGEKYFTTLKKTATSANAFGAPASQYMVGTTTIGTYASSPVITYSTATLASKVATDLNGYTLANAAGDTDYKVNNTDSVSFSSATTVVKLSDSSNTSSAALSVSTETLAKAIADETANGKSVSIYADTDNKITTITEVVYTVAKVTSVSTSSTMTTYTLSTTVSGNDYVSDSASDTIVIAGSIAKGDYVTYVKPIGASSVLYVYPTTTVSGIQTSNSDYYKTIVVGGTTYTVGTGVTGVSMSDFGNKTTSNIYYIDQFGLAVKTTASSASTDYAYIIGKYASTSTTVDGTVPSAQLKVVKADGSVGTYTLKLTKLTASSSLVTSPATNAENQMDFGAGAGDVALAAGDYVIAGTSYCVYNADAVYTGTATASSVANKEITDFVAAYPVIGYTISDTTLTAETHETASASMDGSSVYVSSSTSGLGYGIISRTTTENAVATISSTATYVLYNTSTGTASVYTGNSGLPTAATNLTGYIVAKSTVASGAACTASVVFCTTNTTYSAATVAYAYVNHSKYSLGYDASNNQVYTYYATAPDGSTVNLTLTPATNSTLTAAIADDGIYSYSSDNVLTAQKAVSSNLASGDTGIGTQYFHATAMTITDNVLTLTSDASRAYNITDDTKVVYVDTTLSTVSNRTGYVVLALNSSNAITNNVATIYVTGTTT